MGVISASDRASRALERAREYRRKGLWGDASILDWFRLSVRGSGERCAVVDRLGRQLTFRELDAESSTLALWMIERGVRPGDIVGIQLPNWCEFTVVYAACLKVGAVVNPLPTNLRLAELTHITRQCKTVMTFHPTKFRHTEFEEMAQKLRRVSTTVRDCVLVDRLGVPARELPTLNRIVEVPDVLPRVMEHEASGDDLAAVLFTSGSEAEPKGVMLSHNNLISSERSFAATLNITWSDSMFMPAPVGHATGFMHGVTMPLIAQIPSVLCDSTDGVDMLDMLCKYEATGGMAVPAIAESILEHCVASGRGLPALRFLCCGGSPVPRELMRRARGQGVDLYSVYGSTESAPHTMTTFSDTAERVIQTDGRPCWGTEIKVVDPATRESVEPGQPGEEASRGPAVFMGYLNQPELTAAVVDDDGWYYSGDLCVMDPDGYIRITGRLKDVIIRGGENIAAAEVELILRSHPRIREVAVIGIDDPVLGQRVGACIVSRDGGAVAIPELREFFIARDFAKFKIPEQVFLLDQMPLTSSGKISKGRLRKRYGAGRERGGGQE